MVDDIEELANFKWRFKILFPKFEYLREAIADMVSFTLYDVNNNPVDTKGSGIQKLILLSVISYIANKLKNQEIIWALDEPEVFLQPKLQKKLFSELKQISSDQHVFITTHSQFFIDLENLDNTFLFLANIEEKTYVRRPNEKFLMIKTKIFDDNSYKKLSKIKSQLGIESTDSWIVLPENIIVEGWIDKLYLLALSKALDIELPNILVASGAQNIPHLVRFIDEYLLSENFHVKFLCLLDCDKEGRDVGAKLKSTLKNKPVKRIEKIDTRYIVRCDGLECSNETKLTIEDFVYPEIIIKAVNSFLSKKKGQTSLLDVEEVAKKRLQNAFRNKTIMEFLIDELRQLNPDKSPPPLTDINVKKYINKEAVKLLENSDLVRKFDRNYPVVRKFLEDLVEFFN